MKARTVRSVALMLLASAALSWAETDADRVKTAKALFFDRRYAEARKAWLDILSTSRAAAAEAAAYWVARSSENLGEHQRAFREYGEFLSRRPSDRALAEEARTSRVGLAARLYKAGQRQHLGVLHEALADPSRSVRYYAALQLSNLGPDAGRPAVPVLKTIVQSERDEDLVQRAKLGLLRLDPGALASVTAQRTSDPPANRMLRLRIFEKGGARPRISINLPIGLAEMAFKSLPDEAKVELGKKGYDADHFWEQLNRLAPTEVIDIEGDEGERIQIWIE